MASNEKAEEPMCDPTILRTKRVLLVENVILENVMPCIRKVLDFTQIDTIKGEKTNADRTRKVLEYIGRLNAGKQYGAFNALLKAIGGTQPELFQDLVGRAPTKTETTFCVKDISQAVKVNIIGTDHCTDTKLDEKIHLDYEHVELSIVDGKSGRESTREVPHEYVDHLTRLQGKGRNISPCNILNDKSKPNEKVLVFGRPGVGKSTTTQWLARKWAQGMWATGVTLLFLLQVRFLTNDNPITALQLLTAYSLYQLQSMADYTVLSSWLNNPTSRILVFIDGLDEIPGFESRMINTRRIGDLTHKAHPIDLIVNILRGHLLPHSIVISASRPFLGLSVLPVDSKAEVLGLTSSKVTEYVKRRYRKEAKHILSVLEQNPILLSVCGITFYCMLISRLLSEGVMLSDVETQTYTRLMAFIMVQYTSRKITNSDFALEMNRHLSKLAKMAFSGIFQAEGSTKLAKIVFDEKDLIKFNLGSTETLNCLKKTGIIQIREQFIRHHKSIVTEFFHLSGQEMLAVLHFLSNPEHSDDVLQKVFAGGHFDMALIYMFGLNFDKMSTSIDKLWTAMGSSNPHADTSISSKLSSFIDRLWEDSNDTLKVCQLIYEAQWVTKAVDMFSRIVPKGKLSIEMVTMTAIDILAVDFVCRSAGSLKSITLSGVNASDTFVKVAMAKLFEHSQDTMQELNLSSNIISDDGAKAIASAIKQNGILRTLILQVNSIAVAGAVAIADILRHSTTLQDLDISHNSIGDDGAKSIAENLNSLKILDISANNIGDAGAVSIADMLGHNSSLQRLYMSYNTMRRVGAMADMLTQNTSLHILDVSDNKIGDTGAQAMAAALYRNTTLKELAISCNDIGDHGKKALTNVRKHCSTLIDI